MYTSIAETEWHIHTHAHTHTHTHSAQVSMLNNSIHVARVSITCLSLSNMSIPLILYISSLSPPSPSQTKQGKGHKFCHLRVKPLPDNYVMFESVESPGQYLALDSNGSCRSPVGLGPGDQDAHFFVRVEVKFGRNAQDVCALQGINADIIHAHTHTHTHTHTHVVT